MKKKIKKKDLNEEKDKKRKKANIKRKRERKERKIHMNKGLNERNKDTLKKDLNEGK